jgi:hypothetical protein
MCHDQVVFVLDLELDFHTFGIYSYEFFFDNRGIDSVVLVLLVARKPSLLHKDYVIVDGNWLVVGFLKPSTHLTHSGLSIEDSNHNLQAVVQQSNIESFTQVGPLRQPNPPKCWIEDARGSKVGSIVFTN